MSKRIELEVAKDKDATLSFTSEEFTCGEKLQWAIVTSSSGIVGGTPDITLEVLIGGIWVAFNLDGELVDLTKNKIYYSEQLPGGKVRIKYNPGTTSAGTYSIYLEFK